jgi:hypothetical protein
MGELRVRRSCSILGISVTISLFLGKVPARAERAVIMEELNQKGIHNLYQNGDFEPVIDVLENFQKRIPEYSFSDSVFIAKHLAVVYTANPETREKGRYYMMRLLELLPSAKLVDMFVSEEIDRIFEKVREEHVAKLHGFGLDSLTVPIQDHQDAKGKTLGVNDSISSQMTSWNRPRTWIIGGVVGVTLGTAAFLYFQHPRRSEEIPELIVPQKEEK